jgi:hypothetical protein
VYGHNEDVSGHHHPNTSWTGKRAARGGWGKKKQAIEKLLPAITTICTYNVRGADLLQF